MPFVTVDDVRLHYEDSGTGDPVVMIMGTGTRGQAWHLHQVPALVAAGYRVITLDNRGIPPSDPAPADLTVGDLVGDVAGLIEQLELAPCRLVGTSMGAYVAQELALARPELVRQAVLMASHCRSDTMRSVLSQAERDLYDAGLELPARYRAAVRAMQTLSPRTLNDDQSVADWLDLLELSGERGPGARAQMGLEPMPDRRSAYRGIGVPCHVLSFADDLIASPAQGAELAEVIPGASFEVVPDAGHYGYLERPEPVNESICRFFAAVRMPAGR
ncbi:alpha/beta fold hydrolase [Micromonospora echinospora]|uniref:alpha/beta fold hydrolase n=1 Tax=Micromonospora echinospora TaxID=1877 RepID=UPI003CEC2C6D